MRFSLTRLLSEELGRGRPGSLGPAVFRAGVYVLLTGCAAGLALWSAAGVIAQRWIAEPTLVPAVRLAALGLPAGGVSAMLSGYFTAVGRVWKTSAVQLIQQLGRMALSVLALRRLAAGDPGAICAALAGAGAAAEFAAMWAMGLLYAWDIRRAPSTGPSGPDLTGRLLRLSVPVGISAIARNALGTLRQVLVPRGLRASGLSGTAALAGYGVVSGMAMPLLLFPACLPGALAEMLLPALTRMQAAGQTDRLRARVRSLLRDTFFLSAGAGTVFFLSADVLAGVLYRSAEAARYIRLLSPMVPLIYTDLVTDGCLKGLGEMMRSMTYNIAEALLGLVMTCTLLPRYALAGYILTMYICEIFNFTLSVGRLKKVLDR